VEFGLVVAWLVQASGLMECPRGPPFLSFAKQNKPPALTETQSHVLLSDEKISKGLLCLFVMLYYQINSILYFLCTAECKVASLCSLFLSMFIHFVGGGGVHMHQYYAFAF
jgi:hypothetical protein